jgi:hypothetical protein
MLKKNILFPKISLLEVHKDSHSCKGNDIFGENFKIGFDLIHIRYQTNKRLCLELYLEELVKR